MAVFVAASDEAAGANHRSQFVYCGFLAPLNDWNLFTEEWDRRVLAGPPRIPYLHMTDIRSRKWRETYQLTDSEAERRVDEAAAVISETPSLTPVGSTLDSGHLLDTFTKKVMIGNGARKSFVGDYLAFVSYAYTVLLFCYTNRPDAEKVDFIMEKNGEVTDHIREFYAGMPIALQHVGRPELIPLLGDLISAGKERAPLQAADVLCWHTQRYNQGTLDAIGAVRYAPMATRIGIKFDYANEHLSELWENLHRDELNNDQ